MANEKKVVFSGDASLLNKAFASIRQARKEIGLDDEKFAKVSKENASELLKALELEIKQRTRLNNLKREEAAIAAKERRDKGIMEDPRHKKQYISDYKDEMFAAQQQAFKEKGASNDIRTNIENIKAGLTKEEGEKESVFKSVLTANLVTEGIKKAFKVIGGLGNAVTGVNDESQGVGSMFGAVTKGIGYGLSAGVGSLASIWPGLGGTLATMGVATTDLTAGMVEAGKNREEQEQKNKIIAQTRLYAATGKGIGPNIGLGLSSTESAQMAEQYARSGGNARNLGSRVFESYAMQKAFGLDQGQMLEQEKLGRITGTGGAQNIANVITALKSQGIIKGNDYSQVPELVNAQNSLIREQSKLMSTVDAVQAGGIVATLAQIGGGFSGERLGERISSVNQSLINPQGDFQQASNFAALTSLPEFQNASYLQLLKAQQGGLSTKGFLKAKLDLLSQQYGGVGTEGFTMGVMDTTGLSVADSELLGNFYKNNPQALQDFAGSTGDVQKMLGQQPSGVTDYEKGAAKIVEGYSVNFVEGINAQVEVLAQKAGKEFAETFTAMFGKGAKTGVNPNPTPPPGTKSGAGVSF